MKSQSLIPKKTQSKSVKHLVIKGSQNIPYDANIMAQIEQQKSYQQELEKKNKMQSFLNSTKLNASKLYKQKTQEITEKINSKKAILEKQKDLKSKYTIVKKNEPSKVDNESKKIESTKNIKCQPTKVQWKKSQSNVDRVKIPQEKLVYQNDSDEENLSQIDSDIDQQKQSNPNDMIKFRQNVRNAMLHKFNFKK